MEPRTRGVAFAGRPREIDDDAARRAEGRFRALVQSSDDFVASVDGSLRLRFANAAAQAVLGFDPERQPGKALVEHVHPDDVRVVSAAVARVVGTTEPCASFTFRIWATEGRWRHLEAMACAVVTNGEVQEVIIDARDVTDQRASDKWFRQLLETASEGIWTVDTAGTTTFANARMAEIVGMPVDKLVGSSAFDLLPPEEVTHVFAEFERNFNSGVRNPVNLHLLRGDGSTIAVRITTSPMRDDDGHITGGLVVVTDLSALVDTEKELTLREAWLDAIVLNAFDLVVGLSEDGVITFASPSTLEILGLEEKSGVIGTHLASFIHPDDAEETIAAFVRSMDGPNSRDPYECRVRQGDGTYLWFEFTATNLIGEIGSVIIHGRDVTERVEATAQQERNEAWLHAILHQAFDVVVAIDAEGTMTFATHGIEAFLGQPLADLLGTSLVDVVHADDRGLVSAVIDSAKENPGASRSVELRVTRPGGSSIWIEALVTNLLLDPAVERIIINARDITDRHLAEAKIVYHAMHDALTGLPNRNLLADRLDQAMARRKRRKGRVAVAFIDVDHFKILNDSSGHTVGDNVLREVASRLRRVCRPGDTVARFGGDEFVLISEEVATLKDARDLGIRVLKSVFDDPFEVNNDTIHISASIGVTLEEEGISPDRLLADADTAMYRAKEHGRSRVEVFESSMRAAAASHLQTVEALRRAVDEGDLIVHYQPIVKLVDQHIVGAEALVRLHHPALGIIGPTEFIPLAESNGLIDAIGIRIFEVACAQLARCREMAPHSPFYMSVNVSPVQLRSNRIFDLPVIARRYGLDPHDLVLEITESSLLSEDEAMPETIARLRESGFRIAVDDFGTGYSSLGHLKQVAVDMVKIDRLFTAGIGSSAEDTAIVEAILTMAKALDLVVVAEGVESAEQVAALRARQCPNGQGYLFSRAVPADELEWLLSRQVMVA